MLIPETAIVYRRLNALGRLMGASFRLINSYVSIQRETYRFRLALINSDFSQHISGPILYVTCFIDITINSIISRSLLAPDTVFNIGNYLSEFPYIIFSIFVILFVCMNQDVAYKKVHGTVYIVIINCLSIVFDAASKSLFSELFYLQFGTRMFFPLILCFCGSLVWRTILRGFIVAFAHSEAERAALFKKNFAPNPHSIKINSSFARGIIFSLCYSIFRPLFGALFTQMLCAFGDCCNVFILVAYYIKAGACETDDLYTMALRYFCDWAQRIFKLKMGNALSLPLRTESKTTNC